MRKILFLDSYYQGFIESLSSEAGMNTLDDFKERILGNRFGTGIALSDEFERLGWKTEVVVPNFRDMQVAWRHQNDLVKPIMQGWNHGPRIARLPLSNPFSTRIPHIHQTLIEQIRMMQPDVVYVQDLNFLNSGMIKKIKRESSLVVGEIASTLPPRRLLRGYDLIVSSIDPVVDQISSIGIESRWVPLGFDLKNWSNFDHESNPREIDVVFIGSISKYQKSTLPLLSKVASKVENFSIYGPSSTRIALAGASLSHIYKGEIWGSEMYRILGRSKISLNRHAEVAQGFANNMRMYESTGMGALLLTDATKKLDRLFTENDEVLTYSNPDEAAEMLPEILSDVERLKSIAIKGQRRTHAEHTYANRAERLQEMFSEFTP
jgi:spore maturation protein CgeB